jgi:hypothetical protein
MRPPALIVNDGTSRAFLSDGMPGTGGLFVPEMHRFPLKQTIAQVLVEYAEQNHPVLMVDDGTRRTGGILYHVAHMLGLRTPDALSEERSSVPLRVTDDLEGAWSSAQGVHVGDFQHVGGFEVMYHPAYGEPDDHACDMGDAHGVLLVMEYPNRDSRTLLMREHDLTRDASGRLARKS